MNTVQHRISLSNGVTIAVTVTNKLNVTSNWILEVRQASRSKPTGATVVGLACRRNPDSADKRAATLQLCCDNKCIVVQLRHLGSNVNSEIKSELKYNDFIFAAADVGDFAELLNGYGIEFSTAVDIMSLPAPPGNFRDAPCGRPCEQLGHKEINITSSSPTPPGKLGDARCGRLHEQLAQRLMGIKIDKPSYVEGSAWEEKVLTYDQVKDACIDAYLAEKLGKFLINGQ